MLESLGDGVVGGVGNAAAFDCAVSLPDAKAAENDPQQFLRVGVADNVTDGLEGEAQLLGDQFGWLV